MNSLCIHRALGYFMEGSNTPTDSKLLDDGLVIVDANGPIKDQGRLKRKNIRRQSTFLAVGAVGIFAAYSGVLSLQSSLNFEDSLGTTSLAICFVTTCLMNATLVPVLLHIFGAKLSLLLSDATFIIFSFANLYPDKATLYPAAVALGIGEAIMWPTIWMFVARHGESYVMASKSQPEIYMDESMKNPQFREAVAVKTRWIAGRFCTIFSSYLIIGNLMAYGILNFDSSKSQNISNAMAMNNSNLTYSRLGNKEVHCGSKDCYEYTDNNTEESNFKVTSTALRYALFAGYTFLQICSLVFHKVLLEDPDTQPRQKTISALKIFPQFLSEILRHLRSPLQILIAPISVYNGVMMGFIYGDVTRSYIACPLGVQQVGLAMTFFGISSALGSLLFQSASRRVGKTFFFALIFVMESSLLAFSYFWEPSSDAENSWLVYAVAALYGIVDPIRQAVIAATYPEYFPDNHGIALSIFSMLVAVGYAISFAIGTSICVSVKIITIESLLALSTLCFFIAEMYFCKIKNKG